MAENIKLTKELLEKLKTAGSPEELKVMAMENGIELSEEAAKAAYDKLNTKGALRDEELEKVTAGGDSKPVRRIDEYILDCPYCHAEHMVLPGGGDMTRCPKCGMEFNVEDNVKGTTEYGPVMTFNF